MAVDGTKQSLNYCWYAIIFFTVVAVVSFIVYLFQSDDLSFFEGWRDRDESMETRVSLVAIFSMVMVLVVVLTGIMKEKNYWNNVMMYDRIEDRFFGGAISVSSCLAFVCFLLYGEFGVSRNVCFLFTKNS